MNILIVDDREDNRNLLEALLKGNGHDVEAAANGAEALERLKAGGFDLIISDILMPVMDGFQLCRKVKTDKALCHIPFIIYTATYTGPQDEAFAIKIGADQFIQKPCEPDVFMEAVRDVMTAAKGRDIASMPVPVHEEEILKLYSKRLVRKLEQKMLELEASERKYRMLAENTLDVIWAMDLDLRFTYVNPAVGRLMGYSPEEWIGSRLPEHCDEENFAKMAQIIADEVAKGSDSASGILEVVLLNKNREPVPVEIHGRVIFDENGAPIFLQGVTRNISERKQAEEALRESERRYRTLFESANDAIFIMKGDTFLECNPKTLEMFGCTYEQIIGKQPFTFSPTIQPDGSNSRKKAIEKIRSAYENKTQVFEWRHTKYDGTPFDAQVSLNVVELKTGTHLQAIVRDITERKRAEQNLKESESQLRSLAHRLQEVEESERKALARELHDSVGQNMTALNLNLNILQTQLPLELLEKMGPRLEDSMNLVDETTGRIRDVMALLRPSVLDDYGLVAALRWYGKRFMERTGVSIHLHEHATLSRLSETVESAFFRIVQEALTNIAKHADATDVVLSFEEINGMVRLVIADNGKGFDPIAVSKSGDRKGWGILNMQERAQGLGGQVQVESVPGKGTKILIEMRK